MKRAQAPTPSPRPRSRSPWRRGPNCGTKRAAESFEEYLRRGKERRHG